MAHRRATAGDGGHPPVPPKAATALLPDDRPVRRLCALRALLRRSPTRDVERAHPRVYPSRPGRRACKPPPCCSTAPCASGFQASVPARWPSPLPDGPGSLGRTRHPRCVDFAPFSSTPDVAFLIYGHSFRVAKARLAKDAIEDFNSFHRQQRIHRLGSPSFGIACTYVLDKLGLRL